MLIMLSLFLSSPSAIAQSKCGKKQILSPRESITILARQKYREVMARIDTGATYSSIDKALAKKLKISHNIVGRVKVVNAHGVSWRNLIRVRFMIRNQKRWAYFTLADRSQLEFPVLIGRTSLKGFLVDPEDSEDERN